MMLRSLSVVTRNGLVLNGKIFQNEDAQTVVILLTGVEGNFQNNPFYSVIGERLAKDKADLIVAQTRDAFNRVHSVNQRTGQPEVYGAFDEKFAESTADVEAYLNYAKQKRYSHIILGGQSLGANKVIYYLAHHQDPSIDRFLLMSPVNMDVLRNKITQSQRQVINDYLASGRENRMLPFQLFRWLRSTAANANRWLTDETLNNAHAIRDADFRQLCQVQLEGAFLIGLNDHFTGGQPREYLQILNQQLTTKNSNQLVYIPQAGHIYRNHERQVANDIADLLRTWQMV